MKNLLHLKNLLHRSFKDYYNSVLFVLSTFIIIVSAIPSQAFETYQNYFERETSASININALTETKSSDVTSVINNPMVFLQENLFKNSNFVGELLQICLKLTLATLILVLAWLFVNRIFRLINNKTNALHTKQIIKYIINIKIGSKQLLTEDRFSSILSTIFSYGRTISLAAILLVYFNTFLSLFPITKGFASSVFNSVYTSVSSFVLGIVNYIPNLIFLLILGFMGYNSLKLIGFIFDEIESGSLTITGFDPEWATPTKRTSQILALLLFAVIAFPYLPGSGSQAFQGISIFVGLLFSLGSSSAISNIVAGIILTYTRSFRINDRIQINGTEGVVMEKGLFVTRLINDDMQYISIPNSSVLGSNVINYKSLNTQGNSAPQLMTLDILIPVEASGEELSGLILKAALETPNVLGLPAPILSNSRVNEKFVNYSLTIATTTPGDNLKEEIKIKINDNLQVSPYHSQDSLRVTPL